MHKFLSLIAVTVIASAFSGRVLAGERQFDAEQMRQRALERIKESVGATEEEWKTLLPKIEAVQKAQAAARVGGGFGRRRGGEQAAEQPKPEPKNDVEKKTQELQALLANKDSSADDVKAKTAELREARDKAREEVKKAQAALREGLNPKHEAQLVLVGVLD